MVSPPPRSSLPSTDRPPRDPAAARPRAVLFDMDGVLVDSSAAHVDAWQQYLDERGIAPPAAGIPSLFGRRAVEAVAELLDLDPGSEAARREVTELERYAEERLAARGPGGLLVPGAADLVADLRHAGVRVAVVTSARSHVAEASLGPLQSQVDALVAADDVAHGKPAPDAYLTAAARVGVPPTACVVVEDATVGVEAGRRAGMHVVAVTGTAPAERLREAGAHDVIGRVGDLPQVLRARWPDGPAH